MSTISEGLSTPDSDPIAITHSSTIRRLLDGESSIDRWLVRAGDWCSPILVKETRQSLKSRQFQWTFILLMVAIAGWTLFAVLTSVPAIYFQPAGRYLLAGYIFILVIPACVVVPNAAYRSMANELEQGTFDVLTLSPLSSFQIVLGKLAVASVQSGFYFASLTPCFALTYLLRGVTWMSIFLPLATIAIGSLILIAVGLLLGSLDRARRYSTLISIAMILLTIAGAFTLYGMLTGFVFDMANTSGDPDMQIAFASMFLFFLFLMTYVVLVILAASAAIGMASENYSTTIRWWGFFQSLFMVGLCGAGFGMMISMTTGRGSASVFREAEQMLSFFFITQALHWTVLGVFFVSERGVLTPRSRRRLPATLIQRVFLSWGNPGSGTGYVFILLCLAGVILSSMIFWVWLIMNQGGATRGIATYQSGYGELNCITIGTMVWCWLAFYLGLVRLFMVCFAKNRANRFVLGIVLLLLFQFIGIAGTLYLSTLESNTNTPTFEWYSIANIPWSIVDSHKLPSGALEALLLFSSMVIALNWLTLSRDLTVVKLAVPPRVKEARTESKAILEDDAD
ncbi:MAG: hypothetical protein NTW52_15615 [Planctomycetota bacterium]|nr:hypothetical protein [Planctomycetota bacterium]